MKETSLTDLRHQFGGVRNPDRGPSVVTRRGKPVGILVPLNDPEELDRISLLLSPKFQKILVEARDDIRNRRLLPEDEFWKLVEADTKAREAKKNRKKTKSKARS